MSISALTSFFNNSLSVPVQAHPVFRAVRSAQSGNPNSTPYDSVNLQTGQNSSQSANPLSQDYSQLAKDLQSGNLSGAQQDFAKIQQDLHSQSQATPDAATAGHHRHLGKIGPLLQQVGQELQSGDLSAAQRTFTTLQQDLQQRHWAGGQFPTPAAANSVSVTA